VVAGKVLHPQLPEDVAASLELLVETVQDAEAELAIALDGHGPGVRQVMRGVGLELDALLEIHEVELDLVRAVPQRQVRDEHVQHRGLAGAGLAGNQRVLVRALTQRQVLQPRGPGPAQRHPHV
jgi:hypothetical protein